MEGRPNFLILMVDQQRFAPVYEPPEITAWRNEHLVTQELLKRNGIEFKRHYAGATACSPSRATLYTGQYPSLHGVTQTTGAAKGAFDPDVFWLDRNSVPTMGDYFRAAGYRTFWKGKWHASYEDILIPGTKDAVPSYFQQNGVPDPDRVRLYLEADRLDPFGFTGWVGPEPHGSSPRNSGGSASTGVSGRDVIYAGEAVELIQRLDRRVDDDDSGDDKSDDSSDVAGYDARKPWLIVASFVNPHDIALFGAVTELHPQFDFRIAPNVPEIPPAPTADELLVTKPRAQQSYREVYPKALQPLRDSPRYRRLYYSLHEQVDQQMLRVFLALQQSSFYENTIVLFLSDHGELLGAHGLFQKWYQAYEEAIHVPLIVHSPALIQWRRSTEMLTSHVDVLPTMLGLAGIDIAEVQEQLSQSHSEVHALVGRDLSSLVRGTGEPDRTNEPIYFMTDDDFTRGLNQLTIFGEPYQSVIQPNHVETVITTLPTGAGSTKQVWKYSRYFDNPQFWSEPGQLDRVLRQADGLPVSPPVKVTTCVSTTKRTSVPDEIEMYNLSDDPLETRNLAALVFSTPETRIIQSILADVLQDQCRQKRLAPTSGAVPGMPSCDASGPVMCRPSDTTPSDCAPE